MPREGESRERRADPHFVFFVGQERGIEAADRLDRFAPEDAHDEERRLVREDFRERDGDAVAAQRTRRPSVARAAAVTRVADDDVDVGARLEHGDVLGQKRRIPLVVAVEEGEEAAGGRAERGIARRSGPGVGLRQHTHARIASREPLRQRHRSVRRSIVDDQQFEIAIRLTQHRCDRRGDVRLGVVRRHHYADGSHGAIRESEP